MKDFIRKLIREGLSDKTSYYKSWKRKNVTLRGISKTPDESNTWWAAIQSTICEQGNNFQ